MHQKTLREIAKFLSGMFAGKIVLYFYVLASGFQAIVLAGTPFAGANLFAAFLFNVAIFVVLIYYGWHLSSPIHSPSERTLLLVVGFLSLIIALIHACRVLFGWSLLVDQVAIPLWLSWVGLMLMLYLAYSSFHFALHMKSSKR